MTKALAIASVALRRFVRDRANLFFVFIMPLGIIILIGAQFGGDRAPQLGVFEPADGGPVAAEIVAALQANDAIDFVAVDSPTALRDGVALGNIAYGLEIPGALTTRIDAGETVTLDLIGPTGGAIAPFAAMINRTLAAAGERAAATRFVTSRGGAPAAAASAIATAAATVPTIDVEVAVEGESRFEGLDSGFELGATSQLVLFMFLTGLTGAAALIQARRYGVTLRMLGTPTSASQVILGEGLGRLGVVILQGLYILIVTAIVFQVDWGSLPGSALILLVFGAVGAGAAMLFGSLFSNDQQAAGIGVMVGLGLAALGGCMVPYEIFPPAMQAIARFTPHYWAMDAFTEIQRRAGGVADILPQLAVLAGYAAVLIGLASWRMRTTLGRATR